MWDRYAIWKEEDELQPLKVVGTFLWIAVLVTAFIVLG